MAISIQHSSTETFQTESNDNVMLTNTITLIGGQRKPSITHAAVGISDTALFTTTIVQITASCTIYETLSFKEQIQIYSVSV